MSWYLKVLGQYADFTGRARRREYWMFTLVNIGITAVLVVLLNIIRVVMGGGDHPELGIVLALYWMLVVLPGLAVLVRRLHDTDRSGAFVFLAWIPLIGDIILLVFAATAGNRWPNRYGPDPKADEGAYPQGPVPPVRQCC